MLPFDKGHRAGPQARGRLAASGGKIVRDLGLQELPHGARGNRPPRISGRHVLAAIARLLEGLRRRRGRTERDRPAQRLYGAVRDDPLEEAAAYQQLIEDFSYTQEQVAQRVGRSRSAVTNLLRLFQLPPAVQRLVGEQLISAGHAKAILGHPDRAYQEALAKRTVAEALSVRDVEQLVRERIELESSLDGSAAAGATPTDEPTSGRSGAAEPTGLRPPGLLELEELMADHLDTRVSITMTAKRGKVLIEFANLEDLERIYRRIID